MSKKYNYKTNVNSLHRVYLSRACKNESCKLREKIEWFKILAYINSQEILYLIVQLFVTTKKQQLLLYYYKGITTLLPLALFAKPHKRFYNNTVHLKILYKNNGSLQRKKYSLKVKSKM